jgi:hypothetical protein
LREAQIPPEEIKATIKDEFKKNRFQDDADINTYGLHSFASSYDRNNGTHAVSACFANTLSRVYLGAYADIHVAKSVVLRANELRDAQTPPEDIKAEIHYKFNKTTDNTNTHGLHPFSSSYDRKKDTHTVSACLEYNYKRFCLCVCADIRVADAIVLRANELRDAQIPPHEITATIEDEFNTMTMPLAEYPNEKKRYHAPRRNAAIATSSDSVSSDDDENDIDVSSDDDENEPSDDDVSSDDDENDMGVGDDARMTSFSKQKNTKCTSK